MNLQEFKCILDKMNLPVAYREWQVGQVPSLPYLLFYEKGTINLSADNISYYKQKEIVVELYTHTKNMREEGNLEKLLDEEKLPFESYESYLETEKMYLKAYELII